MMSDMRAQHDTSHRWWVVLALGLVGVLAACVGGATPPPPDEGTLTRPDLVGLIEWNGSPDAVVFRAERVTTTPDGFFSLGEVADCTLYGDNRLVYLLPGEGESTLVAIDTVSSETVRTFIEDLTLNVQLFGQSAGFDALPAEERPSSYERVEVNINDQTHRFDSVGGWVDGYYESLVRRCTEMAAAPAEFAPDTGAWVTVREVTYNPDQPGILWSAANGLDLGTLGTNRQWVTGDAALALWDVLRTAVRPDIQLQQGERTFQAVMQVPGVTRDAPAAP